MSMIRVFALQQRSNTFLAAMVTIAPLLGGCVSAVEDSSSFGFNGNPTGIAAGAATSAAGAPGAPAEGSAVAQAGAATVTAGDSAATAGEVPAAPVEAAVAAAGASAIVTPGADATGADATGADATGADASSGAIIASGRTPIAAYAGATVSPSSETTSAPVTTGAVPKADATLFASLFAQSEAKTPVRNSDSGKNRRVILKSEGAPVDVPSERVALASLPGVKSRESLFEIGQKASADYDAEILEEASGEEGTYEVASLSGFARLAPNGLMVQRPDVQTSCFEPKLVSMLRAVEQRFNTKVVVTSGYRSPTHNKRVNGARKSMHMACKAADIQVPGASKIAVANFLRSLPGRGGVGTYCHTTAVHVDVGRERDWNWACRRRRG